MATARNFELISGNFNAVGTRTTQIVQRNVNFSCTVINLYFLVASPYKLNHFPQLHVVLHSIHKVYVVSFLIFILI